MEIKVLSDDGDVLRLRTVGRIVQSDAAPDPDPMSDLLGSGGYARNVLLSLEETQFIDSSGLSWLVICHKRFSEAGGRMVLHSIATTVLELLHVMRLELVLHLAEDEAAALKFVRGGC